MNLRKAKISMQTQLNLIQTKKCKKRKFTDYTIDKALRAMRLRLDTDYVLNKKICNDCKAWHVVRERKII